MGNLAHWPTPLDFHYSIHYVTSLFIGYYQEKVQRVLNELLVLLLFSVFLFSSKLRVEYLLSNKNHVKPQEICLCVLLLAADDWR